MTNKKRLLVFEVTIQCSKNPSYACERSQMGRKGASEPPNFLSWWVLDPTVTCIMPIPFPEKMIFPDSLNQKMKYECTPAPQQKPG